MKKINNLNIRIGCLALIGAITLSGSFGIGYKVGSKRTSRRIENEQITSVNELKQNLSSSIVSLMKAKASFLEQKDKVGKIPLSDVYVLDTNYCPFDKIGEDAIYSYRYLFTTCKVIPTLNGHSYLSYDGIEEDNQQPNSYDILFSDNKKIMTYRGEGAGNFILNNISKDANEEDPLLCFLPLAYYLEDDEIKDYYTLSEIEAKFYELNSKDHVEKKIRKLD